MLSTRQCSISISTYRTASPLARLLSRPWFTSSGFYWEHAGYFTNHSPVAVCWQDTYRNCNKGGNASHVRRGADNNSPPCFLCNLKHTWAALHINGEARRWKIELGCSRLLGVPAALGGSDRLQLCVMQMLHQSGSRVWNKQTFLLWGRSQHWLFPGRLRQIRSDSTH